MIKIRLLSVLLFMLMLFSSLTSAELIDFENYSKSDKIILNEDINSFYNEKIDSILNMIDEHLLKNYLENLVGYGPRMTGTYGCDISAKYIYQNFKQMALETRYQNWSSFGNEYNRRFFRSQNVEGVHSGSDDKIIVFGAHYDTVKISPGANDDGSGTAAVMAAAYVLSKFDFEHTLKFVAFSGEEIGILGSHVYAKETYENDDDIIAYINADMIGYAVTAEGGKTMGISTTEDMAWVIDSIENINNDHGITFQINTGINDIDGRGWSDYHSFVEYGYETLSCWESDHDPNMHTVEDNLDNINFSYLVNTTRIIAATMAYLADGQEDIHPQVRIISPKLGDLYFEGRNIRNIEDLKIIVIDDIWIWTEIFHESVPIVKAEFYYDDKLEYTDFDSPFKWNLNKFSIREHRIKVVIYDELGRSSADIKDIFYINFFKER